MTRTTSSNTPPPGTRARIVLVVDSLAGGGAEKVVLELARALIAAKVDAVVISLLGQTTYAVPEDIPVHFLYPLNKAPLHSPFKRARHAADLKELLSHISASRGDIDLVVSNLDYSHYIVSACQLKHAVYVVHNAVEQTMERARKMGPLKWLRQRRLFKSLHGKPVIAVSEALKNSLLHLSLFRPASVERIYNPFPIETIREMAEQPVEHIPAHPYLLHIGRYAKQKRHDVLFKALASSGDPRPLVCLGANEKGIRKLAKKMGVENKVIVPGFQQNPYPWIRKADGLVLSSDFEGLSMVILEALICGTPVVSTDCPYGPAELLEDILPDNLVPVGNAAALGRALAKLPGNRIDDMDDSYFDQFASHRIAEQYTALALHGALNG